MAELRDYGRMCRECRSAEEAVRLVTDDIEEETYET